MAQSLTRERLHAELDPYLLPPLSDICWEYAGTRARFTLSGPRSHAPVRSCF